MTREQQQLTMVSAMAASRSPEAALGRATRMDLPGDLEHQQRQQLDRLDSTAAAGMSRRVLHAELPGCEPEEGHEAALPEGAKGAGESVDSVTPAGTPRVRP